MTSMTSSTCSAGWRAMADPRRRRRHPVGLATILAFWIAVPVAVVAGSGTDGAPRGIEALAPVPGESCPDVTLAPGETDPFCGDARPPTVITGSGGGGGINLGFLLPILAAAVAGGVLALGGAYLVLRRRASAPFVPADPGEWWVCRTCGKSNVVGSARCFSCGSWQA